MEVKKSMPSASILEQKKKIVEELTGKLKSQAGVFVDYSGIKVNEDTEMRVKMRAENVDYTVIKNTLMRFAIKNVGFDDLEPILNGTTSLAVSDDDPIAPARIIKEYADKFNGYFEIKGGFMDGKILSVDEVNSIAGIPPLPVLQAQLLGTMLAPIASLAVVLKAIAEKGGAPIDAEVTIPDEAAEPVEAAAEAPVEAVVEAPAAAPVEAAAEAPVEAVAEAAAAAPVEAVAEAPVEAVAEAAVEAAAEAPVEAAAEAPVEAVVEAVVEAHVEAAVEAPVEAVAEAPVEAVVEAPVEAAVEAPVKKAAPAKTSGKASAKKAAPPAEAAAETAVEAAVEATAEVAVEAVAEAAEEAPAKKAAPKPRTRKTAPKPEVESPEEEVNKEENGGKE